MSAHTAPKKNARKRCPHASWPYEWSAGVIETRQLSEELSLNRTSRWDLLPLALWTTASFKTRPCGLPSGNLSSRPPSSLLPRSLCNSSCGRLSSGPLLAMSYRNLFQDPLRVLPKPVGGPCDHPSPPPLKTSSQDLLSPPATASQNLLSSCEQTSAAEASRIGYRSKNP